MKPLKFFVVLLALAGLTVFSGDAWAAKRNLPPGSYKKTCKKIKLTDKGLHAQCKDRNGKYRKTFLPAREMACPNGIENLDGELVCPRG